MTAATAERDLEHLPQIAAFAAALVLLVVCISSLHASDTLAYLMAVGILSAQDHITEEAS